MNSLKRTHPLDILIPDNSLSLLEALVPFVDYSLKKPLVLFIKYRELTAIMQSLNNIEYISNCGFNCKPKNNDDFISNILKFMPDDYASSFSQMKQMMSMFEMMNMMNQGDENNANDCEMKKLYANYRNSEYEDTKNENVEYKGTNYEDTYFEDYRSENSSYQNSKYDDAIKNKDLFSTVMDILDKSN